MAAESKLQQLVVENVVAAIPVGHIYISTLPSSI